MGTRVTRSGCGPECFQSHHVQVRLRCGTESPGTNDTQVRTRVTRPESRAERIESPVPGEAKKESKAIRSRWGTNSPGLVEAQMAKRFTRSR